MEKATFTLSTYKFDKVLIDLDKQVSNELDIRVHPTGLFDTQEKLFHLTFVFEALNNDASEPFVSIRSVSKFKFDNINTIDDIPDYFYNNSIAIIFPYIRAFISTVTLQANIKPLVLPTFNLSSLSEPLKKNTSIK